VIKQPGTKVFGQILDLRGGSLGGIMKRLVEFAASTQREYTSSEARFKKADNFNGE
jgi:hypothetical protein